MPIAMQNFALTWTDTSGVRRASAVSYDKNSANSRKAELEAGGNTDVTVAPIRPGELPQP
ncbi:hypothetical protein ACFWNF_15735 [Streptomyces anulatus]|uniref:hypothetical protein n=1 Tax=Streptomyces anulatus TaxID=1892 RepID=UPI003652AE03